MLPAVQITLPAGLHLTVAMHPLVTLLAVLAATVFVARRAAEARLAWLAPIAATVVLGGARVLYHRVDGGSWFGVGGLASMGGVAAGLAAAPVLARVGGVSVPVLLDALVPAALLALGVGRIGCFLGGCCYGTPTALPWGVVFPDLGGPARHPLQLYSAVADLAIVCAVGRCSAPPGVMAARALAAFAAVRFGLETLRDAATTDTLTGTGLTLPQALCVVLLLGASYSSLLTAKGDSG
jgi:prolipoprotein diacylglyceryltransferase